MQTLRHLHVMCMPGTGKDNLQSCLQAIAMQLVTVHTLPDAHAAVSRSGSSCGSDMVYHLDVVFALEGSWWLVHRLRLLCLGALTGLPLWGVFGVNRTRQRLPIFVNWGWQRLAILVNCRSQAAVLSSSLGVWCPLQRQNLQRESAHAARCHCTSKQV